MSWGIHGQIMTLVAGIAFFMYGMSLASDYLQRLAANQVRELLSSLSNRHWLAILVGIALTIILQSSGAVTSMLVGLGSAEVISLRQVMGVIIGTAVGTTLTVQLISFNVAQWGLPIFAFSFFIFFLTKVKPLKNLAGVMMGFGLLFLGLEMMSFGTQFFKNNEVILDIFHHMSENRFLTIVVTSVFTALIQSSAVTIGLAMSLTASGLITVHEAIYWVYGANIGTTAVALLAAASSNHVGRQIAWGHFLYKVGSVVPFLFVTDIFANWVSETSGDPSRAIANAHTIFNIVSALLFYPFITPGSKLIEAMFPRRASEREFGPKYITGNTYENPAVAYEKAYREALRMGDIVTGMIRDSIEIFRTSDPELSANIRKRDSNVDLLYREIKMFLVKYSENSNLGRDVVQLISYVTDLESAADVIDKGICDLARKKQALKLEFSETGWKEICDFHAQVVEAVALSMSAFHLKDAELAKRVIDKKREIRILERDLKESHLDRLNQGMRESINTSSIHLDLLSDYRRIVSIVANHAYSLSGIVKS